MGRGYIHFGNFNKWKISKINGKILAVNPFFRNISENQHIDLTPPFIKKIIETQNKVKLLIYENNALYLAILRTKTGSNNDVYSVVKKLKIINNRITIRNLDKNSSVIIYDTFGNYTTYKRSKIN